MIIVSILKHFKIIFLILSTFLIETKSVNFTLHSNLLNTAALSDPAISKYISLLDYSRQAVTTYLNTSRNSKSEIFSLDNLYLILKTLLTDRCLIVINNFRDTNILPKIPIPIIYRKFELAFLHREYYTPRNRKTSRKTDLLWISNKYISTLYGNFTSGLNCKLSKYFRGIEPNKVNTGYCVELIPQLYVFATKPWQCQVQIELFMPNNIFQLGKYTQIFRPLYTYHIKFEFVPSL